MTPLPHRLASAPPVYLDHNATSPIRPKAAEAVMRALTIGGNPSSVHACGRAARALVEESREAVARLVGGDASRLAFTGGGTEANALAISGLVGIGEIDRIILGATEHAAVAQAASASGLPVEVWPVDSRGVADLQWLEQRLRGAPAQRTLVALMLANNETGVIQPVVEAAAATRAAGARLHVDAVQAAGKIAIDMEALGADTLAISAHKLGGPQGVGALVYATGVRLQPMLRGGGQERGLRAGTENVAGIAGFAAAAAAALRDLPGAALQAGPRDAAAERLKAQGAVVVGEGATRLPNTLCMAARGWSSALQVMTLDLEGVMVSAGSACSSGKVTPSAALQAMGLDNLAGAAIRASGGWNTTHQDWERFEQAWTALYARHAARDRVRRIEVGEYA